MFPRTFHKSDSVLRSQPDENRRMNAPPEIVYRDSANAGAVLFLRPAQLWFGSSIDGVRRICTVLGSCVALTLWHRQLRYGGMCHFVLPRREARHTQLDGRFGDEAIELMVQATARVGTALSDYEAGLFGGANMFASNAKVTLDVGAQNALLARHLLQHYGIVPRHTELLGTEHRHISLNLSNGAIVMRTGASVQRIPEERKCQIKFEQ